MSTIQAGGSWVQDFGLVTVLKYVWFGSLVIKGATR